MRECALGFYKNELACECWPIPTTVICDIACIYPDPRYSCDCSSNFYEFKNLFPSWATRSDIEKSMGTTVYEWPVDMVDRIPYPEDTTINYDDPEQPVGP